MRLRYIQCMDFVFEEVETPEYSDISKLSKAIKDGDIIKVKATDGAVDYVNGNYIMYVGVYE